MSNKAKSNHLNEMRKVMDQAELSAKAFMSKIISLLTYSTSGGTGVRGGRVQLKHEKPTETDPNK